VGEVPYLQDDDARVVDEVVKEVLIVFNVVIVFFASNCDGPVKKDGDNEELGTVWGDVGSCHPTGQGWACGSNGAITGEYEFECCFNGFVV